jgi:hypothetical protein
MPVFNKPFVFERASNILSFSRNTLPITDNSFHIFMPWTKAADDELMFKVRAELKSQGSFTFPFITDEESPCLSNILKIENQITGRVESHLVMSDGESIHIFKISKIKNSFESSSDMQIQFEQADKASKWIEVSDVYVYRASHDSGVSIADDLENLVSDEQKNFFFSPIQQIDILSEAKEESLNWLSSERQLTYDYFIRNCELEENIFQGTWSDLNPRTRHCLVSFEQKRHEALVAKDVEKLMHLKSSFESYLSAMLNEINEVYINPLMHTFLNYECLKVAWDEVKDGLINPDLKKILEKMHSRDDKQLTSLEDFLFYVETIKSCLFSLKNRFSRKIGKEEYLVVEAFLTKQEGMIESLFSRELDVKIRSLTEVKSWLSVILNERETLSHKEIKTASLKLTHLLSVLSSTNYEDNIFFRIIEEKTGKNFVKRSFEDEVRTLVLPKKLQNVS